MFKVESPQNLVSPSLQEHTSGKLTTDDIDRARTHNRPWHPITRGSLTCPPSQIVGSKKCCRKPAPTNSNIQSTNKLNLQSTVKSLPKACVINHPWRTLQHEVGSQGRTVSHALRIAELAKAEPATGTVSSIYSEPTKGSRGCGPKGGLTPEDGSFGPDKLAMARGPSWPLSLMVTN